MSITLNSTEQKAYDDFKSYIIKYCKDFTCDDSLFPSEVDKEEFLIRFKYYLKNKGDQVNIEKIINLPSINKSVRPAKAGMLVNNLISGITVDHYYSHNLNEAYWDYFLGATNEFMRECVPSLIGFMSIIVCILIYNFAPFMSEMNVMAKIFAILPIGMVSLIISMTTLMAILLTKVIGSYFDYFRLINRNFPEFKKRYSYYI